MPTTSPDLPGACCLPAAPSQGELGTKHANAQSPAPGPCQGLWGLAGLVTRLPHLLLCGASAPLTLLTF